MKYFGKLIAFHDFSAQVSSAPMVFSLLTALGILYHNRFTLQQLMLPYFLKRLRIDVELSEDRRGLHIF
jgi:hypothetical protein